MQLDDAERTILKALQQDARLSMRELAALSGVSTPTASAKVRSLEEMGLIRGYRVSLDPRLLGRASYLLEVETRPSRAAALAEALARLDGIEDVVETAGGRLFARCLAAGHDGLQATLHALAAMDNVHTYRVHPVVRETPGEGRYLEEGARLAVACHLCGGPIHGAGVKKRLQEGEREREHWFCCKNCAAGYEAKLAKVSEAAKARHRA